MLARMAGMHAALPTAPPRANPPPRADEGAVLSGSGSNGALSSLKGGSAAAAGRLSQPGPGRAADVGRLRDQLSDLTV